MVYLRKGLFAALGWAFLGITSAAAGGCCDAAWNVCGCDAYPQRIYLQPAPGVYLADQGPHYSGPGPDYRQPVYYPDQDLLPYPYIRGKRWWRHQRWHTQQHRRTRW